MTVFLTDPIAVSISPLTQAQKQGSQCTLPPNRRNVVGLN